LFPRPAVQKRRHGIASDFELPTLGIREHETCEGFDVGNRPEELDVHPDGRALGERNDRVTAAMGKVELEVSTSALEHGLAVSSIGEPDCGWGATEPIGKHTSERDPSNDVAGAVQIRVETLGPAELIVREPMPAGASGAGPHVQVDVPQVKGRIGRAHAYGGRREIRSAFVAQYDVIDSQSWPHPPSDGPFRGAALPIPRRVDR